MGFKNFTRSILALLISLSAFAQTSIEIGPEKQILDILITPSDTSITYQDLALVEKEKPSYFLISKGKKSGPYLNCEKYNFMNSQGEWEAYLIVTTKKGQNILWKGFEFEGFENPAINAANENYCAIIDDGKKGSFYEIFDLKSNGKSVEKSKAFKERIMNVQVSPKGDVYVHLNSPREDAAHSFIYKDVRVDGYYNFHFYEWLNVDGVHIPFVNGIFPDDDAPAGTRNHIYLGGEMKMSLIAILYDMEFFSDLSDFVLKGYNGENDGARVYTMNKTYGPYDKVDNLTLEEDNDFTFDYESDGKWFSYRNSTGAIEDISETAEYYDWKSTAPNGIDFVKSVSGDDDITRYYYNDEMILEVDGIEDLQVVQWTSDNKPILLHNLLISADPDPYDEEIVYGWLPAGYRLYLKDHWSETYQNVVEVAESPTGELALAVKQEDKFYVIRESKTYGPFDLMYTFGVERDAFLKWDESGEKISYYVISNGKSIVFENDRSMYEFNNIIRCYWNNSVENSIYTVITNMQCFVENDFYNVPLTNREFGNDMEEEMRSQEIADKYDVLNSIENGAYIRFGDIGFDGFCFIQDVELHEDKETISFKNLNDSYVIYNGELYTGSIESNVMIYVENETLKIQPLN